MKEKVSALLDGALDDDASSRILESLRRDGALRREWENYCLIGDLLREDEALPSDFTVNVMRCLDEEPTVLAPPVRSEAGRVLARRFMPIAASVMGVAAVAWVAVSLNRTGQDSLSVAAARVPAVAMATPSSGAAAVHGGSEPTEREYLFAHQTMAPSAAMPGVALYVRTVSDARTAGER